MREAFVIARKWNYKITELNDDAEDADDADDADDAGDADDANDATSADVIIV